MRRRREEGDMRSGRDEERERGGEAERWRGRDEERKRQGEGERMRGGERRHFLTWQRRVVKCLIGGTLSGDFVCDQIMMNIHRLSYSFVTVSLSVSVDIKHINV